MKVARDENTTRKGRGKEKVGSVRLRKICGKRKGETA